MGTWFAQHRELLTAFGAVNAAMLLGGGVASAAVSRTRRLRRAGYSTEYVYLTRHQSLRSSLVVMAALVGLQLAACLILGLVTGDIDARTYLQFALPSAVLLVNNHRDRDSDARGGRKTLAILLGTAATRRLYSALLLLSPGGALGLARLCPLGLTVFLAPGLLGGFLIRQMFALPISSRLNGLIAQTGVFQMLILGALIAAGALCD